MRYHLTAADNIAVGRIEARDDRARIVAAAERSLADEVIAQAAAAATTRCIGKRFRTGVDLSGGEWQKIAIARAYMRDAQRADPRRADRRARRARRVRGVPALQGAERRARPRVLISHRFSSVRMADRILVLADGAGRGRGHARGAAGAGRALRGAVRAAGRGLSLTLAPGCPGGGAGCARRTRADEPADARRVVSPPSPPGSPAPTARRRSPRSPRSPPSSTGLSTSTSV